MAQRIRTELPPTQPSRPSEVRAHLLQPGDTVKHRGIVCVIDRAAYDGSLVTILASTPKGITIEFSVSPDTPVRLTSETGEPAGS